MPSTSKTFRKMIENDPCDFGPFSVRNGTWRYGTKFINKWDVPSAMHKWLKREGKFDRLEPQIVKNRLRLFS